MLGRYVHDNKYRLTIFDGVGFQLELASPRDIVETPASNFQLEEKIVSSKYFFRKKFENYILSTIISGIHREKTFRGPSLEFSEEVVGHIILNTYDDFFLLRIFAGIPF